MISGIQILGAFFGLAMAYYTFLHFKRKEFTVKEFFFWLILWIGFIASAIFANSLGFFVKRISGLTRPMDFFIVVGFMIIIAMFFYTYSLVRINQRKIESVVRKIAKRKKL